MSKKSKEKGLSFVYDRNGEKMHCGVTSISEFRKLGNSNNHFAPQGCLYFWCGISAV